jgi:hypothetical protein
MLTRLGQKGMWSGPGVPNSPGAADAPPAERRDLTHIVTAAERGKPVASLEGLSSSGKVSRKANRRDCGYRNGEQAKAGL